jgi:hypothetical protein
MPLDAFSRPGPSIGEIFYIAEQEDGGNPADVCVRDAQGTVLARMASRHVHGVGVCTRRHLRRIDHGAQRRQVRANWLSANASFVGAGAPIAIGTTFIFVGDPYSDLPYGRPGSMSASGRRQD